MPNAVFVCLFFNFAESPPKPGWHFRQDKTFSVLLEGTPLVTVPWAKRTALATEQEHDPFQETECAKSWHTAQKPAVSKVDMAELQKIWGQISTEA